jgi:hypothetical protein
LPLAQLWLQEPSRISIFQAAFQLSCLPVSKDNIDHHKSHTHAIFLHPLLTFCRSASSFDLDRRPKAQYLSHATSPCPSVLHSPLYDTIKRQWDLIYHGQNIPLRHSCLDRRFWRQDR